MAINREVKQSKSQLAVARSCNIKASSNLPSTLSSLLNAGISCAHHDQLYFVLFIFEILITTFIFTLSFLQILPYDPPCSPLNLWLFFHWLLLYVYMYFYIHTYIFLDITCWVHIMLLVCMCSGLAGWYSTTNFCSLLWRGPTLPIPVFLSFL